MIDYNALIEIKEKTLSPRQIERLQLNTEIGAFIAANWAGAYDVFNEFWKCALEALEEGSMTKPTHQNDNCDGCEYLSDYEVNKYLCSKHDYIMCTTEYTFCKGDDFKSRINTISKGLTK